MGRSSSRSRPSFGSPTPTAATTSRSSCRPSRCRPTWAADAAPDRGAERTGQGRVRASAGAAVRRRATVLRATGQRPAVRGLRAAARSGRARRARAAGGRAARADRLPSPDRRRPTDGLGHLPSGAGLRHGRSRSGRGATGATDAGGARRPQCGIRAAVRVQVRGACRGPAARGDRANHRGGPATPADGRDRTGIERHRGHRTRPPVDAGGRPGGEGVKAEIYYGKSDVATYRTYGTPLRGLTAIPESSFTGRDNVLLAADIEVQVLGTAFMAAYTEGDNRLVVATDTMKNFIQRESLAFTGATLEAWLMFIGSRFLETYPHMERLRVSGVEIPFQPAVVPATDTEGGFRASEVLFARQHGDRSKADIELTRAQDGTLRLTDLACRRQGLQLMKVSGSSFADFARDEYTTLPERRDRPLYVHLDVGWRYG